MSSPLEDGYELPEEWWAALRLLRTIAIKAKTGVALTPEEYEILIKAKHASDKVAVVEDDPHDEDIHG